MNQQPLHAGSLPLQIITVQVGGHVDRPTDNAPRPGPGSRNGKAVPGAQAPRPFIAKPHRHDRNLQRARQKDAARRQLPPRSSRAIGRDGEIFPLRPPRKFAQRYGTPLERAAPHGAKTHHRRHAGEDVGVVMSRQQHRDVGVPSQIQRQQDVFMPEDIDLRAPVVGMNRIDCRIAEVHAVVERAHPLPDARRGDKRQAADGQRRLELHESDSFLAFMLPTNSPRRLPRRAQS